MTLNHNPAIIFRQLLVDLGVGSDPPSSGSPSLNTWYLHANKNVNEPDQILVVHHTPDIKSGRVMNTGKVDLQYGIQVYGRHKSNATLSAKMESLVTVLDETIYQNTVTVDSTQYLVHAFSNRGPILDIGEEEGKTKRNQMTVNGTITIRVLT